MTTEPDHDLEFAWDDAKAEANLRKHGLSFAEGRTVFSDPLARIFDDSTHSGWSTGRSSLATARAIAWFW